MGGELGWPTRPHSLRRLPCPPLERPHEALLVLKPHLGRDLFDGALCAQEQVHGQVTEHGVRPVQSRNDAQASGPDRVFLRAAFAAAKRCRAASLTLMCTWPLRRTCKLIRRAAWSLKTPRRASRRAFSVPFTSTKERQGLHAVARQTA
jgi:hypothetical protein